MTETNSFYDVREETGNSDHASVAEVCDHLLECARPPRDDEADAGVDQMMAELLERYDEETVRTVIWRILADRHPFRTATVGLDVRNADGVRIGTAAVWTLRELNQTQDSVS